VLGTGGAARSILRTNNAPVGFNHEPVNLDAANSVSFSHLVGDESPRLRRFHVTNSANFAPML
jgi:hypothetical protein